MPVASREAQRDPFPCRRHIVHIPCFDFRRIDHRTIARHNATTDNRRRSKRHFDVHFDASRLPHKRKFGHCTEAKRPFNRYIIITCRFKSRMTLTHFIPRCYGRIALANMLIAFLTLETFVTWNCPIKHHFIANLKRFYVFSDFLDNTRAFMPKLS